MIFIFVGTLYTNVQLNQLQCASWVIAHSQTSSHSCVLQYLLISVFSCYVIYRCPSFHMGPPGTFALGAVVAKCMGNKHELDRYVKLLTAVFPLIMVD